MYSETKQEYKSIYKHFNHRTAERVRAEQIRKQGYDTRGKSHLHNSKRIILEYGCYPVWLYDDDGGVIDTRLPDELCDDIELDAKFRSLQARYKALFINNEQEFSFVGFQSESEYE